MNKLIDFQGHGMLPCRIKANVSCEMAALQLRLHQRQPMMAIHCSEENPSEMDVCVSEAQSLTYINFSLGTR